MMKINIISVIILLLLAIGLTVFYNSIFLSALFIGLFLVLFAKSHLDLSRDKKVLLSEREKRIAILAFLSDGVLVHNGRGRVILMNPKAEELLGVKFEEIKDVKVTPEIWDIKPAYRALVEIIYPELAPSTISRGGESISSEKGLEVHTSRPELRLIVVSNILKDTDGKIDSFIKIFRDISHEALLSKIKSEFVSVAAHQLRTPLAALKWSIRLLLDGDAGKLEQKQEEFLKRSFDITQRMIKLVNDLLDAARMEEGRFGYEFKEIDYPDFMEKLLKNYAVSSDAGGVSILFAKTKDLIPPLYADPDRLSVAVSNLIENALHYTKPGGKIEVKISRDKDYIKTDISDSGVGIPKEEQARVFSKFFRASNAIRLETEGTGLGLFIVKNIIMRHGGEISFKSEEGKGTTFTLLLPLQRDLIPSKEKTAVEDFFEKA